jgi:uncharacterized protein (DUF362 family)
MTKVCLIKADSYEIESLKNSLENLLQPLGGISAIVKKGERVLLKPNLLTASRPTKECTTRREIVYCVAQMVQEVGGKPFLGDSPAFGSAKGVAKANGYLPLCQELNLPIIDFQGDRYKIDNENYQHLRLAKEAMSADVVINLPKIKSHLQLTLTMGVKNLFGCVPGKMKAWWHMEAGKDVHRFSEMLVETAKAIQPNLTIIDGIIGHEGKGPSGGEPRHLGILAASTDVFALDWIMACILQVDPELVPTLLAQKRLGLCGDITDIDFPLLSPDQLKVNNWQLPPTLMPIDFGLPRVLQSTFKHLYIRFLQEPFMAD